MKADLAKLELPPAWCGLVIVRLDVLPTAKAGGFFPISLRRH